VFRPFLDRHSIPVAPELETPGASASIDIEIRADLQPFMDNFVEGVWASFALTPGEVARARARTRLHAVLVEGAIRELDRLAAGGDLAGVEVTADFLGFRHYSPARLADTFRVVDVGFIGWPGRPGDPEVPVLRDVAHRLGRLLVVTFGARGVLAFDGRGSGEDTFVAVDAVPVVGTTVGCGDAFIAGFLREWRRSADVRRAIEAGKGPGAEATAWRRPLPDEAYGDEARLALGAADEAAVAASPGAAAAQ
jgi:fructoselysine 6-kinase